MGKTFKDYITVTDGYQFSNKYFANSGKYILLTLANYNSNGGFKNNPYDCIYYDGYFPEKYILSKNDLLIAMTHERLLGSPIFIPESNKYLHRRMMGLIHCNEKLDKVYAYYLFNSRYVREQLIKLANGTIVKNLTVSLIYQTKVNIPDSIDYQKKVAQTLWSLDQKIELNNKINDNLYYYSTVA